MTRIEKRWAEGVFAAMLPAPQRTTAVFWSCMSTGAPTFAPGVRLMLAAIVLLPLLDRRFLRPFPLLSPDEREVFLTALDANPSYLARQLVATFKILACFAAFDEAAP